MAEDPKPAANEDAAEGDRAMIDRELARQDKKPTEDGKQKKDTQRN